MMSMHLSFQRESRFFSPIVWPGAIEMLREFAPDMIVTLIDDVYSLQQKIQAGSYFRLRELTAWRSTETLLADILAREVFPDFTKEPGFPCQHSFVVSGKHPASMMRQLVFEPKRVKVYACIPISRTRDDEVGRLEVDGIVQVLNDEFIVFNPLTIDEKPLEAIASRAGAGDKAYFEADSRWPAKPPVFCDDQTTYPVELEANEVCEITEQIGLGKSDIQNNIYLRDLRLIDQSDCVFCYRPMFGREYFSQGMRSEVNYAQNTRATPIRVIFLHDSKVDGEPDDPLGPTMSSVVTTIEEGKRIIREEVESKAER